MIRGLPFKVARTRFSNLTCHGRVGTDRWPLWLMHPCCACSISPGVVVLVVSCMQRGKEEPTLLPRSFLRVYFWHSTLLDQS
ncbi:uncharacterized protein BO80DRAFT_10849 [Aspergillus ibericus CBS 121593]|uniref:Uncharacterized protein n=1 Tax=Aspergillus ibericus CBS 121593 TaxID=1448316 RepID=A0A395HFF5_9EURO|nr:hypothetical protein BO80DRAFT_10849 [Aspergillus ibericus CBS 121593]RAL06376.1 hypothetical protein BO80DRAFT_10849 [Aspergillus ibericus CBS 121593]